MHLMLTPSTVSSWPGAAVEEVPLIPSMRSSTNFEVPPRPPSLLSGVDVQTAAEEVITCTQALRPSIAVQEQPAPSSHVSGADVEGLPCPLLLGSATPAREPPCSPGPPSGAKGWLFLERWRTGRGLPLPANAIYQFLGGRGVPSRRPWARYTPATLNWRRAANVLFDLCARPKLLKQLLIAPFSRPSGFSTSTWRLQPVARCCDVSTRSSPV